MADPKSLYQEVILDHNRKPRNFGTLENASHSATGHNPLCGDHIGLALRLNGDAIDGIAFQGEACAICKASASMMTATVKGRTRQDAETLIREFRDMATGKLDLAALVTHKLPLERYGEAIDLLEKRQAIKVCFLPWES